MGRWVTIDGHHLYMNDASAGPGAAADAMTSAQAANSGRSGREFLLWAQHRSLNGGVSTQPTDRYPNHTDWFEANGMPSYGKEFDRVPRGQLIIDHNTKQIHISREDRNAFTPNDAIRGIKKRHGVEGYEVHDAKLS